MQINNSNFLISEVSRQHTKSIYHLLKNNENWMKMGMKELPSYTKHLKYWNSYFVNQEKNQFVASISENVIGLIGSRVSIENSSAYIWLCVHGDYLGIGVGSRLLEFAKQFLGSYHIHKIYTSVSLYNQPSLQFFESNNFCIINNLPIEFSEHNASNRRFLFKNIREKKLYL